jgi:hypothetical protein
MGWTTMRFVYDANARNAADATANFSETRPALAHSEKASRDGTT